MFKELLSFLLNIFIPKNFKLIKSGFVQCYILYISYY